MIGEMRLLTLDARYQWLSHWALYGREFRDNAKVCMEKLLQAYGESEARQDEEA